METPTKVIFRKFKEGDIIALFPELPGDNNPATCNSYMHVGQHGVADIGIIRDTKPAHELEYKALYNELISIGYNLIVKQRTNYRSMGIRRDIINKQRAQ